ncbi:hypothetical protein [Flavobacterium sp. AJR]|jgi:hypothetical protein|uniref:hypothetical protein n=1 Tax=unclassified Flavobacterium TaxID=196869 RepID=UPI000A3D6D34|nr:hypothetical protein [Flavobacterium sp. AJR]OUL60535.1 hypothetical protein B8T70_19890 [Flavobacterium sp. AJR]
MKVTITIIKYVIWLLLSILSGMVWMRIELGKPIDATSFFSIFNALYGFIIIWIGGFIGLVSFIPFVLIDLYYIKRKIQTKLNQNIARILAIIILSGIITLIHYVLEFTLDWV